MSSASNLGYNIGRLVRQEKHEKKQRIKENVAWSCHKISEGGNKAIKYIGYAIFGFIVLGFASIGEWAQYYNGVNFFSFFGLLFWLIVLIFVGIALMITSAIVNKACYKKKELIE